MVNEDRTQISRVKSKRYWSILKEKARQKNVRLSYKFKWTNFKPIMQKHGIKQEKWDSVFVRNAQKQGRFRRFCYKQINALSERKERIDARFHYLKDGENNAMLMFTIGNAVIIRTEDNKQREITINPDTLEFLRNYT